MSVCSSAKPEEKKRTQKILNPGNVFKPHLFSVSQAPFVAEQNESEIYLQANAITMKFSWLLWDL